METHTPAAGSEATESTSKWFEVAFGIGIAVFAAALGVNDLFAGKYGDDELRLATEKASAYLWYQSKGIKETLYEGQRDLISALVQGQVIAPAQATQTEAIVAKLGKDVDRYTREKKEIMLGSAAVGKDNWAQEVDGKLGQVTGIKDMERQLDVLGAAGDRYDMATLFLQLCLVIGAVGILIKQVPMKRIFFGAMLVLGIVGVVFSALAFMKISS
jgi:hypothetical protein